ncbi:MAG: hypothetical protein FJW97_07340 [Actinobacteria bacterium]|nr:hypothetical protein [Actinomycetota bacterium]
MSSTPSRRGRVIASVVVACVLLIGLVIALVSRGQSTETAAVSTTAPTVAPTPTPDPTPEEIVWAGQVCTSISALKQVAGTIPESAFREFDPTKDLAVQAQEQVDKAMAKLQTPLDELGFALGAVPLDYTDAAVALSQSQELYETAQAQIDTTRDTVNRALSAGTPIEGVLLFGQAIDSGRQAYDTGRKLLTELEGLDSDERLRGSFGKAPECRSL